LVRATIWRQVLGFVLDGVVGRFSARRDSEEMRGTARRISLPRRVVIDLMRASAGMPFVAVRRRLSIGRLAAARTDLRNRPAWAVIFAKAFANFHRPSR
jgi:hypothetical protein